MIVNQPLVFVDLETTGASIHKDRITEIGIVSVDENGVEQWSTLVNPGQSIPAFIQQLTGINNEMVANAPAFDSIAEEVLSRLKGRLFVAHNARFDYGFLKHSFARLGIPFRSNTLCTVKLSKSLYPEHYKHNLDALVARHGLVAGDRHRALTDAELLWQFLQVASKELGPETVAAAILQQIQQPTLPAGVDADSVDSLPEGPGVYRFYGETGALLYVGKSTQIRKRVLSHFSQDHKDARQQAMVQQIRKVEAVETCGEFGALLLEASLIKRDRPLYNQLLRANDASCCWILSQEPNGQLKPQLIKADQPREEGEIRYGLFHSAKDAQKALRKLVDHHRLCLIYSGLETAGKRNNSPCFNYQIHKCDGACVGKESVGFHNARLLAALSKLKQASWPYQGAIIVAEPDNSQLHCDFHVINDWCYLGTAKSKDEAHVLAQTTPVKFDADLCKIVQKHLKAIAPDQIHAAIV